jgi:hypothetical protein
VPVASMPGWLHPRRLRHARRRRVPQGMTPCSPPVTRALATGPYSNQVT